MKINILITSISRKVWLVESFKKALQQEGIDGAVISTDINPLSAGFCSSDRHYVVPLSDEDSFMPEILNICKKEKIKLIVPTRDGELLVFAKNKSRLKEQGIEIMVSDPKIIEICNDKYEFYKFMSENNISTPKTYLPKQIDFSLVRYPLVLKSRTGSGSKSLFKAKNEEELRFFINYSADLVIQEFIEGKEYTVDLFSNFRKQVISVLPRERIETFSGESYKGKTVKDKEIISLAKSVAEKLGVVGHVTLQFIKNNDSLKLIEINPRFGGGAILGIEAGHNTPLSLIRLIAGKVVKPQIGDFKENLIMLRYTKDFFISDKRL